MQPEPARSSQAVPAGPLILILDDDDAWRAALKDSLEREGFTVVGIARSEWILPALDLYRPALVVLDNLMPGPLVGLELLPTLRGRWPSLPIIMMTAFGGRSTADRALALGADGYFDKPFRIAELIQEIRAQIERRRPARS